MEIYWSSGAELNLLDAVDFIATDNPVAAVKLAKSIRAHVELLALTPAIGRAGRARDLGVPDNSYLIVYRIKNSSVQIIRVLHTAQR